MLRYLTNWDLPPPKINIQPQNIHIWGVNIKNHFKHLENLYQLLSYDEQERASKYYFEKDKKYFIIARGILRDIISRYLLIRPESIGFSYNIFGKPYIDPKINMYSLQFNVSHSKELALYIISKNCEVGIDIEKIHSIKNFEDIAQEFFSPQEVSNLKSVPSHLRLVSFFKCWTRKEAFIKAIGNGLSHPLHEFEVSLLPTESPALLKINGDSTLALKWSLTAIKPHPEYEAAFIFKGVNKNIEYWRYD